MAEQLPTVWSVWVHAPGNNDWTIDGYNKVADLTSIASAVQLATAPNKLIERYMLFVMRSGITPRWEDPANAKGGALSYRIDAAAAPDAWKRVLYATTGATLCTSQEVMDTVTGITIAPKGATYTLKIWGSDQRLSTPAHLTAECLPAGSRGLFRKHAPD